MSVEIYSKVADDYDITPDQARSIILMAMDDQLGGVPAQPEEVEERPPSREVDPFWKWNTAWQILEPTVAWPTSITLSGYLASKAMASMRAGLPLRAILPKRWGGMGAVELWRANQDPGVAASFQNYYAGGRTGTRPALAPIGELGAPGTGSPAFGVEARVPKPVPKITLRQRIGKLFGKGGGPGMLVSALALPGTIGSFEQLGAAAGAPGLGRTTTIPSPARESQQLPTILEAESIIYGPQGRPAFLTTPLFESQEEFQEEFQKWKEVAETGKGVPPQWYRQLEGAGITGCPTGKNWFPGWTQPYGEKKEVIKPGCYTTKQIEGFERSIEGAFEELGQG